MLRREETKKGVAYHQGAHEGVAVIFGIEFVGAYDGVGGGTGDIRGTCRARKSGGERVRVGNVIWRGHLRGRR